MKDTLSCAINERILIIDGAMGTQLQQAGIPDEAWIFQGTEKEGCNELLNYTAKDIVRTVHENYLKAGADLITTNTFGSFPWVLEEYGMAEESYGLAKAGAELVAEAIARNGREAFVLGSMGPGTKLPSLGHISYDEMASGYQPCVEGLIDGGTDVFMIETCQDPLQIKAALQAINTVLEKRNLSIPIMVSVTIETTGSMLIGTDAETIAAILEPYDLLSLGFNCGSGPIEVKRHVKTLSEYWPGRISVHSNAGLPLNRGGQTVYPMQPDEFSQREKEFLEYEGVTFLGGCCGTSPAHIAALAKLVHGMQPKAPRKAAKSLRVASLFSAVDLKQDPAPLLIGERSNATGSKAFRELLINEKYDDALKVAHQQIKAGAHVLDVNVGFAGRDERKDMAEIVNRYATLPIPLMPDSTQLEGLETALKRIGGKAIINSVNLEDGEEKFAAVCHLAKTFGTVLICLTIDEEGMAKTTERKLAIAERMYHLATEQYGIKPENLIFDLLTFTIGSGDEEYYNAGVELIEAIRELQRRHPEVGTTLGLSNISFGLAKDARIFLNSMFLHHCIKAGLTSAIVNVKHILPLNKISAEDRRACDDLIFNRRENGADPLITFIEHFKGTSADLGGIDDDAFEKLSDEEKIKTLLMEGDKQRLVAILGEIRQRIAPERIVNEILIDGMKVVGELFGSGEMQLPFVLQSAETMKAAVDSLQPFLPKTEKESQTTLVLGTVKGDVHDVGKNLVDIILSNNGFKVVNIGIKVGLEEFVTACQENNADAIGMSGLLVKSTNEMKNNLTELRNRHIDLPVLLGGAALSKSFVDDFCRPQYDGPIFYCRDAFDGITAMGRVEHGGEIDPLLPADRRSEERELKNSSSKEDTAAEDTETIRATPVKTAAFSQPSPIPQAPFYGTKELQLGTDIDPQIIFDWINQDVLFRSRWGYTLKDREAYRKLVTETLKPQFANLKQCFLQGDFFKPVMLYGFFKCRADKNNLIINHQAQEYILPFPRQQTPPHRSIVDYFSSTEDDVIALTLASSGSGIWNHEQEILKQGAYTDYLQIHGLAVELAEAMAEMIHKHVRKKLGILGDEEPDLDKKGSGNYQGNRYSPGYPSCPDLELNKTIFDLLQPERFGITLSETFQMNPEATTVAMVTHHREATYFSLQATLKN